jgi:hypothetical protein
MGGELIRITSSGVSEFVGKLISTNIWIALNDVAEPGNRRCLFHTRAFSGGCTGLRVVEL